MMLVRCLMGLAEGGYVPSSIVATIGRTWFGPIDCGGLAGRIAQLAVGLCGGGLARLVTGLFDFQGDAPRPASAVRELQTPVKFKDIAPLKSVWVNALVIVCLFTGAIPLAVFFPNYLTDHLQFSVESMSQMMAGLGVGSFGRHGAVAGAV
jgi:predicted MFS family arabinose efflux permease